MSFLENLENSMFEDEAGNGYIIQDELPFEAGERLTPEKLDKYNERLKYMEEYGI
jgi:hypothetical protein